MANAKMKKLRKKLNLTQSQVAAKAGCTRSAYANVENGYKAASAELAAKINKALRA